MPVTQNPNAEFLSLPRTSDSVLGETNCAMCDKFVPVKVRRDGWIELRCPTRTGCGYVETALGAAAFNGLMKTVLENPKTQFRRTDAAAVSLALGLNEPAPVEPAPAPPVEPAPAPPVEPAPAPPVESPAVGNDYDADHQALYGE